MTKQSLIDQQPKHDKIKNRNREAAVLSLATGLVLSACGIETGSVDDKKSERLTGEELSASVNAHEAYDDLKVTDIVKCKVTAIAPGPEVNYMEGSPSMMVSLDVEPGDKYNEPLFSDAGEQTGKHWAEIQWNNPTILVNHEFKNSRSMPGAAVPLDEVDPAVRIDPVAPGRPYSMYQIDNSEPKKLTYVVPVNVDEGLTGKRTMSINAEIGRVQLSETPRDEIDTEVKTLNQTCATLEINVQDGKFSILSALDDEDKPIALRN